jgi:hypothetical protein
MAEDEPFLSRWSRLKRRPESKEVAATQPSPEAPDMDRADAPRSGDIEEPLDLSSLPKIEELTAETDIRKFMDARVPAELRQAALRRVWTVDPNIRDFIEMAENQYDWNAPGGVPGFGPLNTVGGTIESVLAKTTELGQASQASVEPAAQAPPEARTDVGAEGGSLSAAAAPASECLRLLQLPSHSLEL